MPAHHSVRVVGVIVSDFRTNVRNEMKADLLPHETAKICIVTSKPAKRHPRIINEARALLSKGFHVEVLDWDRSGCEPKEEVSNYVHYFHFQSFTKRDNVTVLFALDLLCFWLFVLQRVMLLRPKILYVHNVDTIVPAITFCILRRAKFVCYVAELYFSRALKRRSIPHAIRPLVSYMLREFEVPFLNQAEHIIVLTPAMKRYYGSSLKVPISVVFNSPDPDIFYLDITQKEKGKFVMLYPSDISDGCFPFLLNVLKATQFVEGTSVVVVGDIRDSFLLENINSFKNVTVKPRVPFQELREHYNKADCVFALYDSALPNVKCALPLKVQEALFCGVPVIVNKGVYISHIVQGKLGLCVDENNVQEIADAIRKLKDDKLFWLRCRQNALKISHNRFNWDLESKKFMSVIQRVLV